MSLSKCQKIDVIFVFHHLVNFLPICGGVMENGT
jgi:hypothetical protein